MSTEPTTPDAVQQRRLSLARAALKGVETRMGASREAWARPGLPLSSPWTDLLPGGLRQGQVIAVKGSTSLVMALMAEASQQGSWAAMVGMPRVGVVAAARRGIELSRLALIPFPGAQAAAVAGSCVEGMDLVVLGESLALSEADRRRLASRVRERGCVLLAAGSWSGAHSELTVITSTWRGLGAGDGRLRARDLTVEVRERSGGIPRRVQVRLDDDTRSWRASSPARVDVDEGAA